LTHAWGTHYPEVIVSVVRPYLRLGMTLLLAGQFAAFAALPFEACCRTSPAATQEDCCQKGHPGQACPMHSAQHRSAPRDGATRICGAATNLLTAVLGIVGVLPVPAPASIDGTIAAAPSIHMAGSPLVARAPLSPPPRA
jgi:hypothetical protein